jgi:peptidoglycan hydrolase-like protein with peptidoglycan-binding domain
MAGEPLLNKGDTGDWVTYLQQLLEYQQVGSGFTAGTFDDATEAGVRAVQQQHSIEQTGQCDEATWAALTSTASASADGQSTSDTDTGGEPPDDIAVSFQDEMTMPEDSVELTELEELPSNATS